MPRCLTSIVARHVCDQSDDPQVRPGRDLLEVHCNCTWGVMRAYPGRSLEQVKALIANDLVRSKSFEEAGLREKDFLSRRVVASGMTSQSIRQSDHEMGNCQSARETGKREELDRNM